MISPIYFEDVFLTLSTLKGFDIIGGDFNCTTKDHCTGCDTSKIQTRRVLKQYIADINLMEVWREHNPDKIEYSCYSGVGKSRSHIDYFLISVELPSKVKSCWYDSIVISDHAATSLIIHIEELIRGSLTRDYK